MNLHDLESAKRLANYGLRLTFIEGKPNFVDEKESSTALAIQYGTNSSGTCPWVVYLLKIIKGGAECNVELTLDWGRQAHFDPDDYRIKAKLEALLQPLSDSLRKRQEYNLTSFRELFLNELGHGPYNCERSTYITVLRDRFA